ncbi:MAG TPA: Gfo/Idh/MocA family oxidoreductase [Candidatus Dormibacteraeota bacterium]|jgi:predicted dehydrogenase|nr:Gfo/Idh/MocA family oxidoreductase [Candidatus Dormibacteraeota bacterium]
MGNANKVKWGVLGVASIATRKVIPGMQKGDWSEISAIASRDLKKAEAAAKEMRIAKAYGSYEELLADKEIEAIYNPLPNHLHVPWTAKAAEAGRHVLCEKPIALNAAEAETLLAVRARTGVKIGEAFMVKTYPQWLRVRELVLSGKIGELKTIVTVFSYFNRDAKNVRHRVEWGGGGLLDIGCYPITLSRWIYGEEPKRVAGTVENDPQFGTDRMASAVMEFSAGQSIFSCGTQTNYFQRMTLLGTAGRIDVEIPFNAPTNKPLTLTISDGMEFAGGKSEVEMIPAADQYTIQGDAFSRAIRENTEVPVPLEDAIANMKVIDAIFRSAASGMWEKP